MIAQRRIVPSGYIEAVLDLQGTAPLLMNSGEVDRDSETFRAYFNLGRARNKSLEDEARLRELEWTLALYYDAEIGVFVPGKNVHEMIRSAATKWRKGEDVKRSLIVVENRIPLTYDGPRDPDGLWDAGYRYTAMVANAGPSRGRVVRCRPMFENWSLKVDLAYDPEDLDFDTLETIVDRSQKYGLGDYRPLFGSFAATLTVKNRNVPKTNGDAVKKRNGIEDKAHNAFVERIRKN